MRTSAHFPVPRSAVLARGVAVFLGVLVFAEAPALAAPLHFGASLEQSTWQVQSSGARCVLRHAIPEYGMAEFSRGAGQQVLQVRIDLPKPPVESYQAVLRAVPSPWNHGVSARELGTHLMDPSAHSFELGGAEAQSLFDALERGLYVELGFGPVGAPVQAVVSLSTVRFLLAVPEFQTCLAGLTASPPKQTSARAQVASLATPELEVSAAPGVQTPRAAVAPVTEDPFIRSDVDTSSQAKAEPVPEPVPKKEPQKETGAGLELIEEVLLAYGPTQDGLSDAARIELGSFAREYRARKGSDLVLIAGSAGDGPQTRRRALEIKGYLVRNGLPAARVLIHVQGEKLPQRDGQPVKPPADASRMVVWQVR